VTGRAGRLGRSHRPESCGMPQDGTAVKFRADTRQLHRVYGPSDLPAVPVHDYREPATVLYRKSPRELGNSGGTATPTKPE
jgi:hypothetical protein